jgi:response regulator RpfG family c-di-GMP phosphodiesterase
MTTSRPRLLIVDDEPAVLEGLQLHLRRQFTTTVAIGGAEALAIMAADAPFAVVMSDMRMPGMSGAAFLAKVRAVAPDTVRLLLTGYSELDAAIAAVNEGQVFRFLTKPCPPDVLLTQLQAAADQHRLITAERVLLEQTLRGSVKVLTDLLALASPAAFGRAGRVKDRVSLLCEQVGIADRWPIEVAAMLSQIGCITLPPAIVEKHYLGQVLPTAEQVLIDRLPALACQLLGPIPRLEPVRDILAAMDRRCDEVGVPRTVVIPVGARILKIALDHDLLEARGLEPAMVLATLRSRGGWYDPVLLEAWCTLVDPNRGFEIKELRLFELRTGMIFAEDVRTRTGLLLIARGHEATHGLLERLRNFCASGAVAEPFRVHVRLRG